jgi:hypothetical protein
MTCTEARALLPAYAYGDLPADEGAAVAGHLRDCPACRTEAAALGRIRSALDDTPLPPVLVNVPALFNSVADRKVRQWRRLAIAGAALAAGLLLVLRLHVTIGNSQVVIAWGSTFSRDAEALRSGALPTPALRSEDSASQLNDLNDRVQLLQELTRALATDIESRDQERAGEIAAVRARLDAVQQFASRQWADAERTMNALYVAQFKRPEEKTTP